jgi:hypothetical protein
MNARECSTSEQHHEIICMYLFFQVPSYNLMGLEDREALTFLLSCFQAFSNPSSTGL